MKTPPVDFHASSVFNGWMKDYYRILEIHPEASLEVMNNAYRALVRQFHPDLYHSRLKAPMNEKMQAINEAYSVLSNPVTRARYDQRYQEWKQASAAPAPERSPLRGPRLRNVLLWALGTFLLLKFLLAPVLAHPALRLVLLGLAVYLFIRFRSSRNP